MTEQQMQKKIAIYPGTFDPFTNGHLDIALRASKLFDQVVIAIAESQDKSPMFSLDQRAHLARVALEKHPNIRVETFGSLLVEFAQETGSRIIIRGLRAVSDFEYELQMGYANTSLWPEIETVHLMPSLENAFISSTVVRAVLRHGGNISHLVAPKTNRIIQAEYCAQGSCQDPKLQGC